ncbi:unnamed protein product [Zymoseptoria tritici ST99CH_3D7]|uniref:Uncharacterized protein n=1 Tax=Zymoseptoria tritici (strain ST99CH_3D7) TaxID=1276538 RepID=A0A1X7RFE4_ZYMT9|nr:unnamed protein product [Zymoseptoria tritici ST99CH_3D7]
MNWRTTRSNPFHSFHAKLRQRHGSLLFIIKATATSTPHTRSVTPTWTPVALCTPIRISIRHFAGVDRCRRG